MQAKRRHVDGKALCVPFLSVPHRPPLRQPFFCTALVIRTQRGNAKPKEASTRDERPPSHHDMPLSLDLDEVPDHSVPLNAWPWASIELQIEYRPLSQAIFERNSKLERAPLAEPPALDPKIPSVECDQLLGQ